MNRGKKKCAFTVIMLVILVMASSCSTSKKAAIMCSEFGYYKYNITAIGHARKKGLPVQGRIIGKKQHTGSSRKIQNKKRIV